MKTDLSTFSNDEYNPGGYKFTRAIWYVINGLVFKSSWFPFYSLKAELLKIFGAKIGRGVIIKPRVNIKYPWRLTIADNSWIGENVWIDNLADVVIGQNVCVSQGAMLLTGNHNYKKATFDLIAKGITLRDGSWIGARSVVCPGVEVASHAVLSVGSVAVNNLQPYTIYQGNPAEAIRERKFNS